MKTLELKNAKRSETLRIRADEKRENVLWFTISTERQASDGGVLIADGMDAKEFLERPFVLFMHDVERPIGRCVELVRSKEGWDAAVERAPEDSIAPEAMRYWRFLQWAGFGAASIGFNCTEADWNPKAEELAKYGASGQGWIGRKWKLREWSLVTIPADGGAGMHSDPFMTITDADERRAVKTTFAMIGARMSQTANTIPGMTANTAKSGTLSREADPMIVEKLAALETMLVSTNEKIDALTATVNHLAESMIEDEEPEGEPALDVEGEKADEALLNRLEAIGAAFKS